MNNNAAHTLLCNQIMLAIGGLPRVRVFPMKVGAARVSATGQVVKFGTKGMADLLAIVGPYHLWIEVKTGRGVLSEDQQNFRETICRIAGDQHHIVARSVEDAVGAVEQLQKQGRGNA